MPDLDKPNPRVRPLVKRKLDFPTTPAEAAAIADKAAPQTALAVSFAFRLALEHEMEHGPPPGQSPWLTTMMSGEALRQLSDRLQDLTTALLRSHLSPTWMQAQATTVSAIAALGGITAANRLFDRFHPRALVLPFLSDAFLTLSGALPRTVAYELFAETGFTGEDACKAYGAHKAPRIARATVIGGLAPLTGDTLTPVSMFPMVHGTWDDPEHPDFAERQKICDAAVALKPFDLQPDGSVAAFARYQFTLLQQARAMLVSAAQRGSQVCKEFGIDPQRMLEWSMPNRVVIGPLRLGASAANGIVNDIIRLPGLDADLLRAADEHDVDVLAYALDHMTDGLAPLVPQLLPQLRSLAIPNGDDPYLGPDLSELLTGDYRWQLPGLDEISSAALAVIGTDDLAAQSGVKIDADAVRYFRVQRARLKSAQGRRLPINLLVRISTDGDLVVWSTPRPLAGASANQPVLTSELRVALERRTDDGIKYCLPRFFAAFTPHKAQPIALTTRAYMNVLIMMANQGTVAHIRSVQAR